MFRQASSFNIDVTRWDISRVTNMVLMFYSATSFDQTLCWDTSGATTTSMFMNSGGASALGHQNCNHSSPAITNDNINTVVMHWCSNPATTASIYGNISDWDTSGVTDGFYELIYEDCGRASSNMITTSTFNEDISDWNTSS